MIINDNRAEIQAEGMLVESFFNVKQENLAHVFSILRNQLYSNKILAIVREYCTNAYDAHVEAGIEECPIQIKCPTHFEHSLHIRDFGFGLSEEDVFNVFASYGESTKRNTNSQVGMMGLGSKSAFCYSDSFTIVSYNNGEKKVYSAYIDDSGIGKISKISSELSDETGLEIQIPVKNTDIYSFHDVLGTFLREFNPKPIITNYSAIQDIIDNYDPNVLLMGIGWELRKTNYDIIFSCLMGNVLYPININNIGLENEYIYALKRIHGQFVIKANIGDVKPNASREMLDYIPKTKEFLCNKFKFILDELKETAIEKISQSKTYWDAKINYGMLSKYLPNNDNVVNWNGKLLNSSYIDVRNLPIHRVFKDGKWATIDIINADSSATIFFYRGDVQRKSIFIRAQTWMQENSIDDRKVYFIGFDNEKNANDWNANGYLDGANVIDVSIVPFAFRRKDRVISKYEKSEIYGLNTYVKGCKNRDFWYNVHLLSDDENEQLVYIPIKYFAPIDCHISSSKYNDAMSEFVSFVSELKQFKIPVPIKIYGIPYKNVDKLDDNWIHFDSYIQSWLDTMTDSERLNLLYTYNKHKLNSFWIKLAKELGPNDKTGFYNTAEKWFDCQELDNADISRLLKYGYSFDTSEIKEINNKRDELMEQYPLLKAFNNSYSSEHIPELVKYINAM